MFVYVVGRRAELGPFRNGLDAYGDEEFDWKPYLPATDDPVYVMAQRVATDEKLRYEVLRLGNDLIDALRAAEKRNQIVVMLVDCWSLHLDPYKSMMGRYDSLRFRNCAVLVPWNPNDPETEQRADQLEGILRRTFYNQGQDGPVYRTRIRSAADLRAELTAALNEGRRNIMQYHTVFRPAEGVGYDTKPTIQATPRTD